VIIDDEDEEDLAAVLPSPPPAASLRRSSARLSTSSSHSTASIGSSANTCTGTDPSLLGPFSEGFRLSGSTGSGSSSTGINRSSRHRGRSGGCDATATPPQPPAAAPQHELGLLVTRGSDEGTRFSVVHAGKGKDRVVVLGRDASTGVDFALHDPHLSSVHFALKIGKSGAFVQDKHSTNGTMVNGVSIPVRRWKPLNLNDVILVGHTDIKVTSLL